MSSLYQPPTEVKAVTLVYNLHRQKKIALSTTELPLKQLHIVTIKVARELCRPELGNTMLDCCGRSHIPNIRKIGLLKKVRNPRRRPPPKKTKSSRIAGPYCSTRASA